VIEATAAVRESMAEWLASAADSSAVLRTTGSADESRTMVASSLGWVIVAASRAAAIGPW
jgi:hypothetical protein